MKIKLLSFIILVMSLTSMPTHAWTINQYCKSPTETNPPPTYTATTGTCPAKTNNWVDGTCADSGNNKNVSCINNAALVTKEIRKYDYHIISNTNTCIRDSDSTFETNVKVFICKQQ